MSGVFIFPSGGSSGASWVSLTAASADATIAGQGSATWSDETGDELRATVDLTTSQVFNNLGNHGGMLVFDTGLTVADNAVVNLQFTPSTTPDAGKDIYYTFGVAIAATTTIAPATDKSTWWMLLFGPNAAAGTTVHSDVKANNNSTGSGSDRALASRVIFQIAAVDAMLHGAGYLVYSTTSQDRQATALNITGLTSTDKVLVFVAACHRNVDTGSQTVGGNLSMLVSAGPS